MASTENLRVSVIDTLLRLLRGLFLTVKDGLVPHACRALHLLGQLGDFAHRP